MFKSLKQNWMENYKKIHLHLYAHMSTTFNGWVTDEQWKRVTGFFPEVNFFNLLQLYFQFSIYGEIIECKD